MSDAKRDSNRVTSLMGVSSTDGTTPLPILINPATGRVLISATIADNTSTQKVIVAKAGTTVGTRDKINFIEGAGVTLTITDSTPDDRVNVTIAASSGSGTVTDVSVTSANGFTGSVATPTTTPAISIGVDASHYLPTTTDQSNWDAKGVGIVTAVSVASANGVSGSSSGGATPALTISLGAITPTSVNKITLTQPATAATLTILDGKTLTANNTIVLAGTDSTTMTFPATNASIARTDAAQTFTGTQTFSGAVNYTNNAITATANAATIPITARVHTVTNNSAATLTITLATASAVDGQLHLIRILDFSAAAQTITWVNTEDSTVTAPTTSNGSTTLPLTIGFQYNNATSKWRTIASC